MSGPSSAQSLLGADPIELNAMVAAKPGIVEFPISGDATTLAAPFYASITRANAAAPKTLDEVIAATHAARAEAGRAQREKASHTP